MGSDQRRRDVERPDRDAALDLYAGHAAAYDEDTEWAGPERARAVELLALRPGDVVFDVGCGTGLCFDLLREAVGDHGRVVGIEQSVDMLAQAQDRVEEAGWDNIDLVLGSVEDVRLPLPADAALFCFTHDVLRIQAAVENVVSQLRPGARVAVVGPMWAPWWAPGMNLLIWYYNSPYVTTYEGFDEPWSHLAERVPGLSVERQELLGRYFAWGRLGPNAP
jgi:demethylmenaquinone methyltransferase/2-methoxy-6-polyprenyl-1,4-benzoquinol methylase